MSESIGFTWQADPEGVLGDDAIKPDGPARSLRGHMVRGGHVLVCLHSPLPVDHAVAAETLRDLRLDKGPNVGENFSHIAVLGRAAARVAAYTD